MKTLSLDSIAEPSTELRTQQEMFSAHISKAPITHRKKFNPLESRAVDMLVEAGAWAMAAGEVFLLIKIVTYIF